MNLHQLDTKIIDDLKKKNADLRDALIEVRDLLDGYIDVADVDYGVSVANKAMRAAQIIDVVLR